MKLSPIQLLEAHFEKVSLERADSLNSNSERDIAEKLNLQVFKEIKVFPEYWEHEHEIPNLKERTYMVTLGLRTPDDGHFEGYKFEIIVSGAIACLPHEFKTKSVEDMVLEYGLALLYGMLREQFATTTARMSSGQKLLPTLSFLGEKSTPKSKSITNKSSD